MYDLVLHCLPFIKSFTLTSSSLCKRFRIWYHPEFARQVKPIKTFCTSPKYHEVDGMKPLVILVLAIDIKFSASSNVSQARLYHSTLAQGVVIPSSLRFRREFPGFLLASQKGELVMILGSIITEP
jgi:hypothetical protein